MNQSTDRTERNAPVQPVGGALKAPGGTARFYPLLRQRGMLKAIDPGTHCLAIKRGPRQDLVVFQWTATTQFQRAGESITPADLRQGELVNVLYNKESSHLLAKTIQVHRQHESASTQHVHGTNAS